MSEKPHRTDPLTEQETGRGVLIWVDTETTGLNSKDDDILELGIKVTTPGLRILAERSWIVCPPIPKPSTFFPAALGWREKLNANPEVKLMHSESGLFTEVAELEEYERKVRFNDEGNINLVSYLAWLWLTEQLGLKAEVHPMVGSNVANFDRRFLQDKMPVFNSFFHYRNIDISSIKELCKIYRPDVSSEMPKPEKKAHRVLEDIDWSISELKYYLDRFIDLCNYVLV